MPNPKAGAGSIINFPRLIAHGFANTGDRAARALFILAPGENFEKFFEEPSALPPELPPARRKSPQCNSHASSNEIASSSPYGA